MMTSENNLSLPSEKNRKWPGRMTFIVLAIVSGMLLFGLLIRYWMLRNEIADSAFESASNQAIIAAEQLDKDFGGTMVLTEELAQDLSDGALAHEDIDLI